MIDCQRLHGWMRGGSLTVLLAGAMSLPAVAQSTSKEPVQRVPIPQEQATEEGKSKTQTAEQRGRELLEAHCAGCHAIDRTDKNPHEEAPAFRDLSQKYPVDALQEALAEGIMTGHPDMPEFAFEPEDVGAIIAYLESIQVK